eukprot:SAG11_NODE_2394_length_3407_cov_1.720677_2_plen_391_part_00
MLRCAATPAPLPRRTLPAVPVSLSSYPPVLSYPLHSPSPPHSSLPYLGFEVEPVLTLAPWARPSAPQVSDEEQRAVYDHFSEMCLDLDPRSLVHAIHNAKCCGDGHVDAENREQCDPPDLQNTGCTDTCTLVVCPALEPAANGGEVSVTNGGVFPSTASYICPGGGPPSDGDATRTCRTDATWDGEAPTTCCDVLDDGTCLSGTGTIDDPYTIPELPDNCQAYRTPGHDGFFRMSNGVRYCELSVAQPACISQRWGHVCATAWVGHGSWDFWCPNWKNCPPGSHMGNEADFAESPKATTYDMGTGLGAYTDDVWFFNRDYSSLCSGGPNSWQNHQPGSGCTQSGSGVTSGCAADSGHFTWRQAGEPQSGTRTTSCSRSDCSRGIVCVQDW